MELKKITNYCLLKAIKKYNINVADFESEEEIKKQIKRNYTLQYYEKNRDRIKAYYRNRYKQLIAKQKINTDTINNAVGNDVSNSVNLIDNSIDNI